MYRYVNYNVSMAKEFVNKKQDRFEENVVRDFIVMTLYYIPVIISRLNVTTSRY